PARCPPVRLQHRIGVTEHRPVSGYRNRQGSSEENKVPENHYGFRWNPCGLTDSDEPLRIRVCRGASIPDVAPLAGLRVCYFGRYDQNYPRNAFLTKCLQRAGADVISIRDDRPLVMRTPSLVWRASRERIDLILVAFRAHSDMFSARLLANARRVPIVFDP